ncbi:PTS sugar transporter subunit IIA [Lysobacter korlensis]|uniref:PTS sugar transporter subunit IIA n=1 Tax=Lysobacter korlensis TaxID=553636 RepID=A0ABV6RZI0_9GAMM
MPRRKPLPELLAEGSIRLDCRASDRDDAIRQAGEALVEAGAVDPTYVDAMLERERSVSTYVGESVAFPHATLAEADAVQRDAIVVLRFPDGVDWDGNRVVVVIGLAALGRGHIGLLSRLAAVLLEPGKAEVIRSAVTPAAVYEALGSDPDS